MKIMVTTVIENAGKILMVQEGKGSAIGKWTFPGGSLEEGENILEAAIRETEEETGYKVELEYVIAIHKYVVNGKECFRIVFGAKIISGELNPKDKGIAAANWMELETIKNMKEDLARDFASKEDIMQRIEKKEQYPLEVIKNLI